MKILVTGAAGFIGWRVSGLLLERGYEVKGIDNLNDYYDPALKRWRLKDLSRYKRFSFKKIDVADRRSLMRLFKENKFNAIIHLAARAGVRASLEDPWVYLEANTEGTLNVLEGARTYGIKKVVLASTSSLYSYASMPFREDAPTDRPLSPYGATKKAAELLGYTYHYLYGIDVIIPRYFTVYGPAGRPDMSYFRFIKNIYNGLPITVYGDGRQKRDFTYVDDIAEGTIRCLNLKGYEVFNLGNDRPVELMYLINLIEEALGMKAVIEWKPRHPADMPATWADITRAKNLLGWTPQTSLEDGIIKTVRWFMENRRFLRT
jgi:UDP-glucuronate 4-epimerase